MNDEDNPHFTLTASERALYRVAWEAHGKQERPFVTELARRAGISTEVAYRYYETLEAAGLWPWKPERKAPTPSETIVTAEQIRLGRIAIFREHARHDPELSDLDGLDPRAERLQRLQMKLRRTA